MFIITITVLWVTEEASCMTCHCCLCQSQVHGRVSGSGRGADAAGDPGSEARKGGRQNRRPHLSASHRQCWPQVQGAHL